MTCGRPDVRRCLLVPARPISCRATPTAGAADPAGRSTSAHQCRDGHGDGIPHGDRHGARGGIGAIHRNLSIEQQASSREGQEVGIGHDSRSGDGGPEQRIVDALEVMRRYHISLPVTRNGQLVGILTTATALREAPRPQGQRSDDARQPDHRPAGSASRGQGDPARHRSKSFSSSTPKPLEGVDHGQGHPEVGATPQCVQGPPRRCASPRDRHRDDRLERVERVVARGRCPGDRHRPRHSANVIDTLKEAKHNHPPSRSWPATWLPPRARDLAVLEPTRSRSAWPGVHLYDPRRLGVGVPQLTAYPSAPSGTRLGIPVIADGGSSFPATSPKRGGRCTRRHDRRLLPARRKARAKHPVPGRSYKLYRAWGRSRPCASAKAAATATCRTTSRASEAGAGGIEGLCPTRPAVVHRGAAGRRLKAGMAYCGCRTIADCTRMRVSCA